MINPKLNTVQISPIGIIHSPYKEKFAIPRQPGLVTDGAAELHLMAPFNQPEMVRGLEQFSHIWLIFLFHQTMHQGWHTMVRPPRLGGNQRLGLFATRSTFRPNPLGLSLVKLESIHRQPGELILHLASVDLVDGTPIVDIKPYLPFAESVVDASAGFAQLAPSANLPSLFSPEAEQIMAKVKYQYPNLRRFISEVLAQDPRPAYHKHQQKIRHYAVHLLTFNIRWYVDNNINYVIAIEEQSF